jgi:predicted permease
MMALRSLFLRRTVERELDEELRFHLEQMEAFAETRGQQLAEARPQMPRYVSGLDKVKEACRDMRTLRPFEEFLGDLRLGVRRLRKNPGFTLTAIITIALGIGANAAIFSLLNAVLLRPLPGVQSPDDLVLFSDGSFEGSVVATTPEAGTVAAYSFPLYNRLRDNLRLFDDIAAQQSNTTGAVVHQAGSDSADGAPASARSVTANYFEVLGVNPLLGRIFRADDQTSPGANPVLILSYGYWQRRFGGTPSIVGSQLIVNGFPYTVVGVTPPSFIGTKIGAATDIWVPITMQVELMRRESRLSSADSTWWLLVMGRIKHDVSLRQAQAEANVVLEQFLAESLGSADARGARNRVHAELFPGARGVSSPRRQFGLSLVVLMAGVGLLLFIACINVSHLLLARAARRQAEVSLQLALGATRSRIVRQLVTEGMLLAVLGGVTGLVIGRWCTTSLVRLASTGRTPLVVDTTPDVRVLAFGALLIVATAVLFGLVPAWQASLTHLNDSLSAKSRTLLGTPGRRALGRLLLISQVALSLLLLMGAGLLTQTLRNLQEVDKGFREADVLLVNLNSRLTELSPQQLVPVYEQLLDRISSLPIQSASMAVDTPLSGNTNTTDISIPGRASALEDDMEVQVVVVTPRYFETMGMNIVEGRGVTADDRAGAPRVTVINEALAGRFFNAGGVLGRRLRAGGQAQELTVVGVVKNARVNDLRSEPRPIVYLPLAQSPEFLRGLQVRTAGEPGGLAAEIRQIIRNTNAKLAVNEVSTLRQQVDRSLVRERLIATLSSAFGMLALILVCVGLYGVLSQSVAQRTSEIGVRVALGSTHRGIQWLVMRESLVVVLSGIAIGVPAALATGRGMAGLLFGLSAIDLRTLSATVAVVLVVTILASYLPAWRASRVDPIVALRYE